MKPERIFTVLFLCTGNSARSIMAEAILNQLAPEKFRAYSAGSHPKGTVHPYALEALRHFRYPIDGLRSKSWDEFTGPGAPLIDLVITLCDAAASAACPLWPGHPVTAHWGLPDPAAAPGTEADKRAAFVETLCLLQRRLEPFTRLPVATLGRLLMQQQLNTIEQTIEPAGNQLNSSQW